MLGLLLLVLSAEPGAHAPRHRDTPPVAGDERVLPAIRKNTRHFHRCADHLPPGAEGRVVIRFSLDRYGHAHGLSEPEDTLQVPAVVTCLEIAILEIEFGRAATESERVDVPFFLRARE